MGTLSMAGFKNFSVAALVAVVASVTAAHAQEMSEKSVTVLMDYAWTLVPAQFSTPDGKIILTDKKKREESMIPIDVAREVIRVGRISAHAQVCELIDDQKANHQALMKREADKKKWSDQQMLFMNQLHLTTVMLLTGKVKVVDGVDGGKEVSIDKDKTSTATCSDEERSKVKEVIAAYIKGGSAAAAPVAANAPGKETKQ